MGYGDDSDALVEAQRLQLALELVAVDIAVVRLEAVVTGQLYTSLTHSAFGQQPGRVVGTAHVAHLAAARQIVQRPQSLVQRRLVIREVVW